MTAIETEIPADPNDPAWHEARRTFLGASDAPAVLGISPWATPLDVWASKLNVGRQFMGNLATDMGHALEELIAQKWSERTGRIYWAPQVTVRHPDPALEHIAASVDRIADKQGVLPGPLAAEELLECKYVGPTTAHQWRSGVPVYVQAQCQVQMAVTGAQRVHVCALIVDRAPTWETWPIERDDAVIAEIIDRLNAFWRDHVEGQQRPEDDGTWDADRVARRLEDMYQPPDEANAARLPHELAQTVADIKRTKALIKDLERQVKAAENELRCWMIDNACTDAYIDDNAKPVVTWRTIHRKGYQVEPCDYQQLKVS